MNNDAQAPKGRNVNNPVRKRGGQGISLPFARRTYLPRCTGIAPREVQGGTSCIPELRSASLHLLGVIHRQPLRGFENIELGIKNWLTPQLEIN
jgi:hypothetical protein